LKIKPYIDILVTTLPISNDIDSKRDGRRLVEIMLTNNKWELLSSLCGVLEEFAEAIEQLGGSKYITHSIMSPMLKEVKKRIRPRNIRLQTNMNVNIEEISDVFEEEKEGELAENTQNTLGNKVDINKPLETQNILEKVKLDLYNAMELYWDREETEILILALLDSRIKSLDFVNNDEIRDEAKELLEKKYIELKGDSSSLENIHQTPTTFSSTRSGRKLLLSIFE
jgi:hypothetical protein